MVKDTDVVYVALLKTTSLCTFVANKSQIHRGSIFTFSDSRPTVITLHNVFAVHRGMFSVLEDILSTLGVFSTLGGYHEYTGGCSVDWVSIQIQLFSQ